MKTKLLILIMLVSGLGMLMPGFALAAGHGGRGHGGGGHGGRWHGGGWGHTNYSFSFGFGYYGPGPYYYPYYYSHYYPSYYSYYYPYYYPYYPYDYSGVVVERPVIVERPVVEVRRTTEQYMNPADADEETLNLFASIRIKKENLLKQLDTADKAERIKAIGGLAGLSYDEQVRERLKDILLKDPDPDLRKEAAKSFGKVRNEKVISILEEVRVADSDRGVREEADKAIKRIKGIGSS